MKGFDKFLDIIDILSYKPEMKIKGHARFITSFGKLISLSCVLVIMIMAILITVDAITRKSFTVIYNLDNREIPSIKINESQIGLLLLDALGKEIVEHERYFNFMVKFWKIEIPNNYSQNTNDYKQTYLPRNIITDLPLRNCSSLNYTKFNPFYETFSKVYFSGKCIDFSNMTDNLFGKYGGVEGYSTLSIYIRKCVNSSTLNITNCFPEDIIDKKLSQVYFNLISIENDVDSNNFEQPVLEFYKNDMLPLSSTIFKNYFKDMNSIKFSSDNGFFINNEKKYESYRTDKIIESVDLRGKNTLIPGTFSQITYRCSGKTEIFYRSYLKVNTIFAYIGGILQAIILMGRVFVYVFSKNSMLDYLIFHIFDYEEVKSILKNDYKISIRRISNKNSAENNLTLINKDKNKRNIPFSSNVKTIKFNNSNLNNKTAKNTSIHKDLKNIKLNLINNKDDNKTFLKDDSKAYEKYFYSKIKEKNNTRKREFEDIHPNIDLQENKDEKKLENDNQNINNEIGNNININFSNMYILNNNNSDPNCLNQNNNLKQVQKKNEFGTLSNFKKSLLNRKETKGENYSFFTFYDLFCFKEIIFNKTKRKFFDLATKIIDKKFSFEYLMIIQCNLEKLKLLCLNQEQTDLFNRLPNFRIEKHLNEIDNFDVSKNT